MNRRSTFAILAILGVLVVALSFVASAFESWAYPPPETLASVVSPDGRHRCVVTELPPQGPFASSPYTQRAWIEKAGAVGAVGGPPFEHDSDSVSCDDVRATWTEGAGCRVSSSCFTVASGVGPRGQVWTATNE